MTASIERIRRHAFIRRLVFALLILLTIGTGAFTMFSALQANGMSNLEWIQLGLFIVLFAWIAPSF
jgi:membrane glycosyltransferase